MNKKPRIFVDSDVVVSSIISSKGAANLMIQDISIKKFISNLSDKEILKVVERMDLSKKKYSSLKRQLERVDLEQDIKEVLKRYKNYVEDINDAHVVAGAVAAKARFLVSYNLKDYKRDRIKKEFDLLVLTPGQMLQYLRSQKAN